MVDELHYSDPETGERHVLSIEGWQFVIDTEAGEVMRVDWVALALMVRMQVLRPELQFKVSLLKPPGSPMPLYASPGWWLDVLVEKR